MPTMVFHLPWTPDLNGNRAPLIRPARMMAAFQNTGWEVLEVTGPRATRRESMRRVRELVREGKRLDLCYSECATTPTTIIEPGHWPPVPFLDHQFLRFLHRQGVPIGLFYRDVYWRLEDYRHQVSQPWRAVMQLLFRWDLWNYRGFLDKLYLPTLEMGRMLPIFPAERISTLPPGGTIPESPKTSTPPGTLRLLYVGALGHYYRIDTLLAALREVPAARLTVVTHPDQWRAYTASLAVPLPPNVRFTEATGSRLQELYRHTDVAMLFMEPNQFRELTLPVKLFEAIGWGCPMIAGQESMAGKFIAANDLGWVLPIEPTALERLLQDLLAHPGKLHEATRRIQGIRARHTWEARARQVIADLTAIPSPTVDTAGGV